MAGPALSSDAGAVLRLDAIRADYPGLDKSGSVLQRRILNS